MEGLTWNSFGHDSCAVHALLRQASVLVAKKVREKKAEKPEVQVQDAFRVQLAFGLT